MVIRDPCKRCIVQPICKSQCNNRTDYTKTNNAISSILSAIILFFIGYILATLLMGEGKDENIIFLIGCHITVLLSVLQFSFIMKQKKIAIHNEQRFIEKLLRPIQPPYPGPLRKSTTAKGPIK